MTPQQNQQQGSQFSPVQPVVLPTGFGGKQASPNSTIGILTNQVNEIINTGNALGYDTSNLASAFGVAVNQYSRTKDSKYIGQFQSQLNSTAKSVNEIAISRKKEQDRLSLEDQRKLADAVVDLSAGLNTLSNRGVMLPPGLIANIEKLNSNQLSSTEARILAKEVTTLVQDNEPAKMAEAKKLQKEQAETTAGKKRIVERVKKFVTDEGLPKETLKDATGFGEGVGTFFGKTAILPGGNAPKTIRNQQELSIIIEKDLLDATKYLKPVSNDEIKMLRENRPAITDPPEVWAGYLNEIRSVIENDEFITSETPTTTQGQPSTQPAAQQQPQSPISRANARFQKYDVPTPNVGE